MMYKRYILKQAGLFLCAALAALLSAGCAGKSSESLTQNYDDVKSAAESDTSSMQAEQIPYSFTVEVTQNAPGVKSAVIAASQLETMRNEPPDSRVGLERRLLTDKTAAVDVMRSLGYYNGTVDAHIEWDAKPVHVTLIVRPNELFSIANGRIIIEPNGDIPIPSKGKKRLKRLPDTLERFGLPDGAPAVSSTVIAAVDAIPEWFRNNGFPSARVTDTTYRLYPSRKTLEPSITVKIGPFAETGTITVTGAEDVSAEYIKMLAPWNKGRVWNQKSIDLYRDTLLQTSLFREVNVYPDYPPDLRAQIHDKNAAPYRLPDDTLNVAVRVKERAARRVGVGMSYSSDMGPGAEMAWEHRNILGEGENLLLKLDAYTERQEFGASFRKPAFLKKNQNLIANTFVRNETADAYDVCFGYADIGLERGLTRRLRGSIRASVQSGRIRENGESWSDFTVCGLPVTLHYDHTDSLLSPARGYRFEVTGAPYTGLYHEKSFTLGKLQGDFSTYWSPFKKKNGRPDDTLIIALRAALGGMVGSMGRDIEAIPGSLRYYLGGGGTVRGYKYQSIGPLNSMHDPLGGLSFTAFNAELRYKVTNEIGVVPFVDGGAVYEKQSPDFGKDLCWAAGLGLRYHTPIGPMRMDVAFPLNERARQKTFQLYISIGQAF